MPNGSNQQGQQQTATTTATPAVTPAPRPPSAAQRQQIVARNAGQVAAQAGAAAPPVASPAEQMKAAVVVGGTIAVPRVLENARKAFATTMTAELMKKFKAKIAVLEGHAKTQTEAELAQGGTAQELADVKANAAALASSSGAVTAAIQSEAKKVSEDAATAADLATATTAGEKVYTDFQVQVANGAAKEKARAEAAARKTMEPIIAAKLAPIAKTLKTEASGAKYDAQLKAKVEGNVTATNKHGDDLAARKTGGAGIDAIAGTAADASITAAQAKVKAFLEDKLGAKGASRLRSSELRSFRGSLKAGAREQARTDIAAELAGSGGGDATRAYKGMVARDASYGDAKGVVNDHLATLAEDGTKSLFSDAVKAAEKEKLVKLASPAAWTAMRTLTDADQAKLAGAAAATKAVAPETKLWIAALTEEARAWKNKIVKPEQGAAANPITTATETEKVKDKVTNKTDDDGKTVAKRSVEAASGKEALGFLGTIVDMAAPTADTGCKLEVAFKVPLNAGGFLHFVASGEAEKDDTTTRIAMGLKFGAGWETFGFAVSGHAEVFLEAKSKSTTDAVLLLQYGVYRRLADKSPTAAGMFAGKRVSEDRIDMSRAEQNETWAAMVEERALGHDSHYVHSGIGADLGVKLDAGLFKGDASVAHRSGTHIDSATLGAKRGVLDHAGSRGARETTAETAAKDKGKAKRDTSKTVFAINGEFNSVGSLKCGFGGQVTKEIIGGEPFYDTELSFKVPFDVGNVTPATLAQTIVGNFVATAGSMIKTAVKSLQAPTDSMNRAQKVGAATDTAWDALHGIDAAIALGAGDITKGIESSVLAPSTVFGDFSPTNAKSDFVNDDVAKTLGTSQASNSANPFGTESSLQVAFGLKHENGAWKKPHIKLSQSKKFEMAIGGFGAGMKVNVERTKNLLAAGD